MYRSHLNGSAGTDSSRRAAAWKHSTASRIDLPPSALLRRPRLNQAMWFVLSSRRASVKKLLTTASGRPSSSLRTVAVETKLGICVGSRSNALE